MSQTPPKSMSAGKQDPGRHRLSLKKNVGFALLGNSIYELCQWGMLVALAKLASAEDVGAFALALAVCTPITLFFKLNLQAVLVTDVKDEYEQGHFIATRLAMLALALVVISVMALVSYEGSFVAILIVMGLSQAVMAMREILLAYLRKHERLDRAAASQTTAGVLSLIGLVLGIWLTGSLLVAVAGVLAGRLVTLVVADCALTRRTAKQIAEGGHRDTFSPIWSFKAIRVLVILAMPLGISAMLSSLVNQVPRYFIEVFLGMEMLGYFAAIAALPKAGSLVTGAIGRAGLPRLSRLFQFNRPKFHRLMFKLVCVGVALGCMGILLAWLAGETLLRLVFKPEYAEYTDLFIWLMVYGLASYVASIIAYAMASVRFFHLQPFVVGGALAATVVAALLLIPAHGLIGAAWAMSIGRVFHAIGACLVIAWASHRTPPSAKHNVGNTSNEQATEG